MKADNPYDEKYAGQEYYWGKRPSAMCDRVIGLVRPRLDFRPKLLDLGCGEGRNAVYFAKHGFEVVGLDASLPGLEKMRRYAEEVRVHVELIHADVVDYELKKVSENSGALPPPERRADIRTFVSFAKLHLTLLHYLAIQ
jgi:tellurite methyltransferase